METERHIISIWLVDPVGGEIVDWPADSNSDDAVFSPELWDTFVWRAASVRARQFSILSQFADAKRPFLWCGNHDLHLLAADCQNAIENATAIATACNVSEADFSRYINRLLRATRYAMPIQDAGVCIT